MKPILATAIVQFILILFVEIVACLIIPPDIFVRIAYICVDVFFVVYILVPAYRWRA